jgi:ABC transport system ATP-binding/permease protein
MSRSLLLSCERVSKAFGARSLFDDLTFGLFEGDQAGLVGPNGSGKSTLLRLMLGELEPDSGRVRRGTRLEIAYYDQLRSQLDEDSTLVDTISQGAEYIEIGGARKHVMSYLGDFLFPPERARAKVSALSGGERNRLLLARLFSRPANVLVLDEPTNDLDIETLELLESLLQDYAGTLFLVSHDRAFLDNIVTQVIAFEGGGVLREYVGGYSDWQRQRAASEAQRRATKREPAKAAAVREKPKSTRLTYKETRELETLPARIEALEREQAAITDDLARGDVYRDQPERVQALNERYGAIEAELMESLARWEALEARQKLTSG